MSIVGLAFAVVFALFAGFLGLYALRARRSEIPFDSPLGLPGAVIRSSDQAWSRAHAAASPLIGTAAIISLIQAIACGVAGAAPAVFSGDYVWVLAGAGVVLVVLLLVLAVSTGRRAAR